MLNVETILKEISFITSRSSGPGGQNVNKVSSKVMLLFHIGNSQVLSVEEKELLRQKYPGKINKEDVFQIYASKDRSQLVNKKQVMERFINLLQTAFTREIPRKDTKPTYGSKKRRLQHKQEHSEKKKTRQKPHEGYE